jgi:hypothetical protein
MAMTHDFDDDEIELLQTGIAEMLARMLVHIPVDMHESPEWKHQYESLVSLGRKLGLEL